MTTFHRAFCTLLLFLSAAALYTEGNIDQMEEVERLTRRCLDAQQDHEKCLALQKEIEGGNEDGGEVESESTADAGAGSDGGTAGEDGTGDGFQFPAAGDGGDSDVQNSELIRLL